ncbi:MAG: choice-of-anchor J domain-containing protein [Bacteroidales bacterium]|nr:choice-of-anchor J domain-containing protein [Bacteroidales bacterium]
MKKIFTLFFALLAIAFSVKAQVPVFSENFDAGMPAGWTQIDANNDAMGWEHSSNPASYFAAGTDLSGSGHNSSTGFVLSGSYSNVTNQAITPDNWLISPAITLTANSDLSFYVCAQDASYALEHYGVYITTGSGTTTSEFTLLFEETLDANGGSRVQGAWGHKTYSLASYTGQTVRIAFRHFNCNDQFVLNLDDVEVLAQPTDPTIIATPTAVDFGTALLGNTNNATVAVTAYNLTAGVTATTSAPFAVSNDGTTYGTTATVAAAGGTLYLQYTPTAVGTDNGTLTLSSTGATNVTIPLTGAAIECNGTIPYSYSFTDAAANQCWTVVDANNDGYTFEFNTDDGWASVRYNTSLDMDDWLISPIFALTGGQTGSVDYRSGSASWFEKLQIFAIGANDTVALTPVIEAHNTTFETVYFDLSSLTGNYQLGIHGISDADQLRLYVTNVNVYNGAPTASMTTDVTDVNFGTVAVGATSNVQEVVLSTVNMNEAITLATAAPFEVSLDGTTFAATQTIPANSAMVVDDTIYVRFSPTAVGAATQNLTITATSQNATVALTGTGFQCNTIANFPFTETFLENSATAPCWDIVDHNNDGSTFLLNTTNGYAIYQYNSSNNADDYLISPEITLTGNLYGHVDYTCASSSYPEKFSIYVIPANGTIESAVNIVPTVTVTNTTWETQNFALSAYANQTIRIAIKAESDADMYLLGITNFVIEEVPAASITVDPTSMTFSAIAGSPSAAQAANVTAYSLTSNITVSTTAPFEVSTNGTSFNTTATIPAGDFVNQVLYVRYNSSAAGTNNGTVTLTSGSLSATINVSGSAMDCSQAQALPFIEDFDNGMPSCWTILDEDGDGYSWEHSSAPYSYFDPSVDLSGSGNDGSTGFILSGSFSNVTSEALNPDNWLISPTLAIPSQGGKLSFYVAAQDASYAEEHYGVYVSTTGVAPSNFTLLYEETIDEDGGPRAQGAWKQKNVNLPYAGQNIHIAIRHFNCTDMFLLNLDDFTVTAGTGVESHGVKTVVFPNPANNVININSSSNINRVEIFNMMGQMVGNYNVNDVNTQINTSNFANGVYTVKIETENGMSTKKFTVAR